MLCRSEMSGQWMPSLVNATPLVTVQPGPLGPRELEPGILHADRRAKKNHLSTVDHGVSFGWKTQRDG